ncbi:MAG: hypothetical protein AAFY26_24625 [Cyanobacteria bacterium J06638_22]
MKSSTSIWTSSHFITPSSFIHQRPARTSKWQAILNGFVRFLTSNNEPRISTVSQNGTLVWKVYDPQTQERLMFNSESEVRTWLETRYYNG